MSASPSTSIDCGRLNAVGYPSGSPEDLYRQPSGCPSGVDKIPSVKASISAASAVGGAVPTESPIPVGGHKEPSGWETYWECTDPSNPPASATGPDGQVTRRPVGCPSISTLSAAATATASPAEGGPETYWECTDPANPPASATGPNGEVTRRPVGCPSTDGAPSWAPNTENQQPATSTYIGATGTPTNAVPSESLASRPGTFTNPSGSTTSSLFADASADAQKAQQSTNSAAGRKVGVAGLLAGVALAVVNF